MAKKTCKKCGTKTCSRFYEECDHPKLITRGDYLHCACCDDNLGEWRSNEDYFYITGTQYDVN